MTRWLFSSSKPNVVSFKGGNFLYNFLFQKNFYHRQSGGLSYGKIHEVGSLVPLLRLKTMISRFNNCFFPEFLLNLLLPKFLHNIHSLNSYYCKRNDLSSFLGYFWFFGDCTVRFILVALSKSRFDGDVFSKIFNTVYYFVDNCWYWKNFFLRFYILFVV